MANTAATPAGALKTQPTGTKGGSTRLVWAVCIGLFLLSVAVRFAMADFTRQMAVYPDEIRYFEIAKGIWRGDGLQIQGVATGFQKILYSVFIAPAFALQDTAARVRLIAFISSVLISSSVFPVMLLARRLLRGNCAIICAMVLTLTLPDMLFPMTFMSENSSLPLTLWLFWAMWQATLASTPKRAAALGLLAGALAWCVYLNKEMGIAYVIAFALYAGWAFFADREARRVTLVLLGAFMAAFGGLFLLFKATLFAGFGGSYSIISLSELLQGEMLAYFFYALVCNAMMILVAFFFLPVVLPLFRFRSLDMAGRRLYVLALAALIVSTGVTTYSFSIVEHFGAALPWPHIRYSTPLFPVFLVLFLQLCEGPATPQPAPPVKRTARVGMVLCTAAFCAAVLLLLDNPASVHVSSPMLNWLNLFSSPRWFPPVLGEQGELLYYPGVYVLRVAAAVLAPLGLWLLLGRRSRITVAVVLTVMLGINLAGNYFTWGIFQTAYPAREDQVAEVQALNGMCEELSGNLLIVQDPRPALHANNVLNTYFTHRYYATTSARLEAAAEANGGVADTSADITRLVNAYAQGQRGEDIAGVEYFIVVQNVFTPEAGSAELLFDTGTYQLYKNTDPARIVPALQDTAG